MNVHGALNHRGKIGVASKLRKRSPAAAGKLSRLFDIGCAKSETLKQTRGAKMVGAPTHVAHCSTIGGTTLDG
jgi:hypothetical protein